MYVVKSFHPEKNCSKKSLKSTDYYDIDDESMQTLIPEVNRGCFAMKL